MDHNINDGVSVWPSMVQNPEEEHVASLMRRIAQFQLHEHTSSTSTNVHNSSDENGMANTIVGKVEKALDSAQLLQNLFRILEKTMRVERVVAQPPTLTSDEAFPSSTAPHDTTDDAETPNSQVGAATLANHELRRKLKRIQIELKSAEKMFHRAGSAAQVQVRTRRRFTGELITLRRECKVVCMTADRGVKLSDNLMVDCDFYDSSTKRSDSATGLLPIFCSPSGCVCSRLASDFAFKRLSILAQVGSATAEVTLGHEDIAPIAPLMRKAREEGRSTVDVEGVRRVVCLARALRATFLCDHIFSALRKAAVASDNRPTGCVPGGCQISLGPGSRVVWQLTPGHRVTLRLASAGQPGSQDIGSNPSPEQVLALRMATRASWQLHAGYLSLCENNPRPPAADVRQWQGAVITGLRQCIAVQGVCAVLENLRRRLEAARPALVHLTWVLERPSAPFESDVRQIAVRATASGAKMDKVAQELSLRLRVGAGGVAVISSSRGSSVGPILANNQDMESQWCVVRQQLERRLCSWVLDMVHARLSARSSARVGLAGWSQNRTSRTVYVSEWSDGGESDWWRACEQPLLPPCLDDDYDGLSGGGETRYELKAENCHVQCALGNNFTLTLTSAAPDKVGGSNPTQQVTAGADSSAEDALSHFVTQIYKYSVDAVH